MADDTRLPIGTQDGDTYRSDENTGLPGNPKTQVVKIELGGDGVFDGFVSFSNPLPAREPRPTDIDVEGAFTSTSDAQMLAANALRMSFSVANDSDRTLYLRYGSDAVSASDYKVKIPPGGVWTDDFGGEVRGILDGAIGAGQVRFSAEQ